MTNDVTATQETKVTLTVKQNELERNKTDLLASAAKSVLGVLPYGGPLLSELIGNLIPDQRIDRLAKYIIELGSVDISS